MTAAVILGGLTPIMWSSGTGAEVIQRISAPMIGGMITAPPAAPRSRHPFGGE